MAKNSKGVFDLLDKYAYASTYKESSWRKIEGSATTLAKKDVAMVKSATLFKNEGSFGDFYNLSLGIPSLGKFFSVKVDKSTEALCSDRAKVDINSVTFFLITDGEDVKMVASFDEQAIIE